LGNGENEENEEIIVPADETSETPRRDTVRLKRERESSAVKISEYQASRL
jgi:hypothetical protein